MQFRLDPKLARQADENKMPIQESGLYIGKITQAKKVIAGSGTVGVEFSFECPKGSAKASLYTEKANGDPVFGANLVASLMTCLRVKVADEVTAEVDEYDVTVQGFVKKQATIFPDLTGEVAVIYQLEEYVKRDGSVGKRANIKHFLDSETLASAEEILDKAPAKRFNQLQTAYQDIKLPAQIEASEVSYSAPSQTSRPEPSVTVIPQVEITEDDIPF